MSLSSITLSSRLALPESDSSALKPFVPLAETADVSALLGDAEMVGNGTGFDGELRPDVPGEDWVLVRFADGDFGESSMPSLHEGG